MNYRHISLVVRRFSPRRVSVIFLVFAMTWPLRALAQNAAPANVAARPLHPSTSEGQQLFESVCAGCHGLDGRGGERGPDISMRQQAVQLSDGEILGILRGGRAAAGMPPFAFLGDAKLKELLEYIRTLQGKGATVTLPGDARNGKVLFFGKARCSECHMVHGAGGFIGRDLSMYGATLSPADIRANILRPNINPAKANKMTVVTMRDSRKFTGVIRNEDNFSIQLQSLDGTFHLLNRSETALVEFLPDPIMPSDYAAILKPAELDDIVSYLMTVARAKQAGTQTESDDDN
jgi:putative heme-binding domain-containing protein